MGRPREESDMFTRVRRLLGEPHVIYECRQCGTTLESRHDHCEHCGSEDIARYTIE